MLEYKGGGQGGQEMGGGEKEKRGTFRDKVRSLGGEGGEIERGKSGSHTHSFMFARRRMRERKEKKEAINFKICCAGARRKFRSRWTHSGLR